MSGAPMGGGTAQSSEDQAIEFYNHGIHEVGKARDYEQDAAKAGDDDKKVAKALAKARKSYDSSLQDFEKAVDENPSLFQAWNYVGFCQRHLGNYQDALAAYDKALDLNPKYGEAYEYRAEAYLGLNRIEDAKTTYMMLFATVRPLADELMASMHRWIDQRSKDAKGVSAEDLTAFTSWVAERSAIAQQTASLSPIPSAKKRVNWD
jgi:tetratricopeptide (TPR) repeat protein